MCTNKVVKNKGCEIQQIKLITKMLRKFTNQTCAVYLFYIIYLFIFRQICFEI